MPLPILTVGQMRRWESATWATGRTEAEVIVRVGRAAAQRVHDLTRSGQSILLLAGRGHNGDDVRAMVEHLQDRTVELLNIQQPGEGLGPLEQALQKRPAAVVDGLFGIGLNRPLSAEWVSLLEKVNGSGARVIAIDAPSGIDADSGEHFGAAIEASVTLTVGAPKRGLLRRSATPYVGRLEVLEDIGLVSLDEKPDCLFETPFASQLSALSSQLLFGSEDHLPLNSQLSALSFWNMAQDFTDYPPARRVAAHKGTHGHLAIVAGSVGYHGAAVLAARGAQRAQPGLITLHALEGIYEVVASQFQAVMVSRWLASDDLPGPWTAILIGPGLAARDLPESVQNLTKSLWLEAAMPVVVDASALSWVPESTSMLSWPRVLTPHPGEAARMLGTTAEAVQNDREGALREISRKFGGAWVILKGHQTLIGRSTGPLYVNSSGNPHLAQGGSGDLLGGFVAGLLAQPGLQSNVAQAVSYAVWEHGAAADRLQRRRPGWIVEDLADEIGKRE